MKAIIEIPSAEDRRFKSWGKVIKGIDRTKTSGYAFIGAWVDRGRKAELEVGSLILLYDETGSRARHTPSVTIHRVETGGLSDAILESSGRDWALDLRDAVAELLTESTDSTESSTRNPALAHVTDEELIAEVRGRGLNVI